MTAPVVALAAAAVGGLLVGLLAGGFVEFARANGTYAWRRKYLRVARRLRAAQRDLDALAARRKVPGDDPVLSMLSALAGDVDADPADQLAQLARETRDAQRRHPC